MTQTSPMGPHGRGDNATIDYRQQSREFLAKAQEYLAADDLHQAEDLTHDTRLGDLSPITNELH